MWTGILSSTRERFLLSVRLFFIFVLVFPLSVELKQYWHNILPVKYLFLVYFTIACALVPKFTCTAFLRDKWVHCAIWGALVMSYLINGYVELSYINLSMTVLLVRYFHSGIGWLDFQKEKIFILFCLLGLFLKMPFFSWANVRLNFGLGNPNHVAYLISALFFLYLRNRQWLIAAILGLMLVIIKSFAALLVGCAAVVIVLFSFSPWAKHLKKIRFWQVAILPVLLFFTYVVVFKSILGPQNEVYRKKLQELSLNMDGENITIEVPEVFYSNEKRSFFSFSNKIFDLSGYTRVLQFDGLEKEYKSYFLLGDEKGFSARNIWTPHNGILGSIVVFGFLITLLYIYFLNQVFYDIAYRFIVFMPVLAFDTPPSFYGHYFLFIVITAFFPSPDRVNHTA